MFHILRISGQKKDEMTMEDRQIYIVGLGPVKPCDT